MQTRYLLFWFAPGFAIALALPLLMGLAALPPSAFLLYVPVGGAALATGEFATDRYWRLAREHAPDFQAGFLKVLVSGGLGYGLASLVRLLAAFWA